MSCCRYKANNKFSKAKWIKVLRSNRKRQKSQRAYIKIFKSHRRAYKLSKKYQQQKEGQSDRPTKGMSQQQVGGIEKRRDIIIVKSFQSKALRLPEASCLGGCVPGHGPGCDLLRPNSKRPI
ncbi:hypothetical protein QL285_076633 [Trifolium repens]|nr:hypothetical protein QL285_076633 [Trifolium repens]